MDEIAQLFERIFLRPLFERFSKNPVPLQFGDALADIRVAKGLTQEEFCRELNERFVKENLETINVDTISHWETGYRYPKAYNATIIDFIADELHCDDKERAKLHLAFVNTLVTDKGYGKRK